MNSFRSRVVHMPTRDKVVRLALAEERRIYHEEKTETILTLLVLAKCGEKRVFGHDSTKGVYVAFNFRKCAARLFEYFIGAYRVKSDCFNLPNALASNTGAVADRFKCFAGGIRAEPKTASENFTRPLRRRAKKTLYKCGAVKGKRRGRSGPHTFR